MADGLSSITSCFRSSVLHACSFRWVTVESPTAEGGRPQVGLGPTEGEGGVDRWMGVSKPAGPLQFAYLNEVSDNGDIFKKHKKME